MMLPDKRKSPAGNGTPSEDQAGAGSTFIVADPVDVARLARRAGYVIRVVSTLRNGQTRAQHYTSLPAALRAQERAEQRGCLAVLALCRVAPVGFVSEDELIALREAGGLE